MGKISGQTDSGYLVKFKVLVCLAVNCAINKIFLPIGIEQSVNILSII